MSLPRLVDFFSAYAIWIMAGSVLALVAGSLLGAWFIGQLPTDYFLPSRRQHRRRLHPVLELLFIVVKNTVGIALVAAGIVMLFTPGQGLLTILAGLMLANFPGKYRLERRLAQEPRVMRALNWLRRQRKAPPFEPPDHDDADPRLR